MKIKQGDLVVVTTGKDAGKTGKVTKVNKEKGRVTVEKVNIQKKHVKKSSKGPGQRIEREAPIHISNVMILCPKTKKPSRVGYRILENGKKERYAKVSGETLV
ncbi:MAG: 50S ribosomal protein L24 [bacterium]|nr:50S ribosomal protein L24 [bacterium]